MNRLNIQAFNELLDSLIVPTGFKGGDPIETKADLTERLIELWRIRTGHGKNAIPFEEFCSSKVFVDSDAIYIVAPSSSPTSTTGTRPILLQPSLIIFLLLRHRERYRVYDTIEAYANSIRDQLGDLDFKRTNTGVTRCFTNTRFAANVLRAYGFLKYTRVEAYKTWVLSMSGFVVASVALLHGLFAVKSKVPPNDKELHPLIKSAWESVDTYDKFVNALYYLCKPNVDIFRTFRDVLSDAYTLLDQYWQILRDEGKRKVDRREESVALIKRLEALPEIEQFYNEFSVAMNIEKFMTDLGLVRRDAKQYEISQN